MKAKLLRIDYQEKQTLGGLYIFDGVLDIFHCKTLELPWKDNEKRVSCIPTGHYKTHYHISPTFDRCFWIHDVPGRSEILIHKGNYNRDTLGCVLVGSGFADINKDGLLDVTNSQKTVEKLVELLPNIFDLEICGQP